METKIIFDFDFSVFDWFCIFLIALVAGDWGEEKMIIKIKQSENGEQLYIRINPKYIEQCRRELEQQEEEAKETARREVEVEKKYPFMKTVNSFMWGFTSFLSCLMEGDFSKEYRKGNQPYYRKYKQYWEEYYND